MASDQREKFRMPSRAPTYFHWAMNKPCTTNQIYGYELRADIAKHKSSTVHTRPFSSTAFLPEIKDKKRGQSLSERRTKSAGDVLNKSYRPTKPRFNLNEGYEAGPVPVHTRYTWRRPPAASELVGRAGVPEAFVLPASKRRDVLLWHSLSGCLVNVKTRVQPNFPQAVAY